MTLLKEKLLEIEPSSSRQAALLGLLVYQAEESETIYLDQALLGELLTDQDIILLRWNGFEVRDGVITFEPDLLSRQIYGDEIDEDPKHEAPAGWYFTENSINYNIHQSYNSDVVSYKPRERVVTISNDGRNTAAHVDAILALLHRAGEI